MSYQNKKAKVIYESDKDNIINEYIIFCKVFNEQVKEHRMTKQEMPVHLPMFMEEEAKEIEAEVMQQRNQRNDLMSK